MRQQIQQFGRTLSGMVMPNIGAFIAWGFITALFIPEGWIRFLRISIGFPKRKRVKPLLLFYFRLFQRRKTS